MVVVNVFLCYNSVLGGTGKDATGESQYEECDFGRDIQRDEAPDEMEFYVQ